MSDYKMLCKDLHEYSQDFVAFQLGVKFASTVNDAACAIKELQAENEALKRIVENIDINCGNCLYRSREPKECIAESVTFHREAKMTDKESSKIISRQAELMFDEQKSGVPFEEQEGTNGTD